MKKIFVAVLPLLAILANPPKAHAIIILPFLIPALLPAIHIVGVALAGMLAPALGMGVIWSKFFGHSMKRTLGIVIGILLLIGAVIMVILKIQDPGRHFFNENF